jgi:peroxiredoxin Q/BCP
MQSPLASGKKSHVNFKSCFLTFTLCTVGTLSGSLGCQEAIAQLSGSVQAHKMIAAGQKAPDFSLKDENGKTVKLGDFAGKKVVVFFYDKDDSPTTAQEHKRIQQNFKKYKLTDVDVLCIGPDPVASHKAMNTQLKLDYHLLADKDDSIRTLYGLPPAVSGSRGRYGIVIDKKGNVRKVAGGKDELTDSVVSDVFDYVMSTQGSGF